MNKKFLKRTWFVALLIFLTTSCFEPGSKESYLKDFGRFVERIEKNYRNYNENDWKWADNRFGKFNSEWYKNFKDELTEDEKIKVAGWVIKYESYKGSEKARDLYRKFFKDDLENARKDVKKYLKEDFNSDVSKAVEGAKQIGDSALKVLDDIMRELSEKNKK